MRILAVKMLVEHEFSLSDFKQLQSKVRARDLKTQEDYLLKET